MKKFKSIFSAFLICFLLNQVVAQEQPAKPDIPIRKGRMTLFLDIENSPSGPSADLIILRNSLIWIETGGKLGYFVSNRNMVGIQLHSGFININTTDPSNNFISTFRNNQFGVWHRYYIPLKKFAPFIEAEVQFGWSRLSTLEPTPSGSWELQYHNFPTYGVGLGIGAAVYLSDNLVADVSSKYTINNSVNPVFGRTAYNWTTQAKLGILFGPGERKAMDSPFAPKRFLLGVNGFINYQHKLTGALRSIARLQLNASFGKFLSKRSVLGPKIITSHAIQVNIDREISYSLSNFGGVFYRYYFPLNKIGIFLEPSILAGSNPATVIANGSFVGGSGGRFRPSFIGSAIAGTSIFFNQDVGMDISFGYQVSANTSNPRGSIFTGSWVFNVGVLGLLK